MPTTVSRALRVGARRENAENSTLGEAAILIGADSKMPVGKCQSGNAALHNFIETGREFVINSLKKLSSTGQAKLIGNMRENSGSPKSVSCP